MKKIILLLLFILTLSACKPKATDEFAPYYGQPQPAQVVVNSEIYDSEVGSTTWVYIDSEGNPVGELGDAFAVVTPTKPIFAKSPLSLTLRLPIPINPTELWYRVFNVTDKSDQPEWQVGRWTYLKNQEETKPPSLLYEQELAFSLTPGTYVLEVHATWVGSPITDLEADYGFLIEIQE